MTERCKPGSSDRARDSSYETPDHMPRARPVFRARVIASTCALLGGLIWVPGVRAGVDIEITGVRSTLEANVRAFLSLTRYQKRDDVSRETLERLRKRIPGEVRDALKPYGYYDPQVKQELGREDDDWKLRVNITPGPAVRFSEVEILFSGEGAADPALRALAADRDLKAGRRLSHPAYDRKKSELLQVASNEGYLDARFTRSELLIDLEARRARAYLHLDTGPRYRFGRIDIAQNVLRDDIMRRLIRFRAGDPYSLDALLRSQYVLDDSQYFATVEVQTGRRDTQALTVPVTVRAEPNRKHRYAASVGYATDTKTRGRLSWDNRRINDRGHRSKVELTGSSVVSSVTGRYIIPVRDIALEKLELAVGWTEEELGDTLSTRTELIPGLTQVKGNWQQVLFVRLNNETTELAGSESTQFLIIPGISYATLPPGVLTTDPRHWSLFGELTGSPSTFGSDASYLRFRAEGERVYDLSEKWHVRLRGQIGASWVADFSELPASQRFFAGGDRSVRGFALNELSPMDADGNRIGARHMIAASFELERDVWRNLRVAAFYDIGNAIDDFSDPLEYSVGVGVRWQIAVVSLGVDVAQALSEPGRSPRLHLHLSTLY